MKTREELIREEEARQPATGKPSSRPTSPDLANSQDAGRRPASPKLSALPEPARGSRFTLTLQNLPSLTDKKAASGMRHSASEPTFSPDDMASPKSPSSPLSAGRSSGSRGSKSPDSPSGKHSMFLSTRGSSQDANPEIYLKYLQASIEDAIQNALSDDYYLAEFSCSNTFSTVNPGHQFHCVIASKKNNNVVFNKTYSAFTLNSIDNFIESFNKDCEFAKLTAEAITYGLDQNNFILAAITLAFGQAVFVTGESKALGNWTTCYRLNFNKTLKEWRFTLPPGIDDERYKYLIGPYAEGKTTSAPTDLKNSNLIWERLEGNRSLPPEQVQKPAPKLGM